MGSISAALSFPVLAPPREESSGMGREGRNAGSYSRTAGGNRAQHFDTISIMMYRTKNKPESENSMTFKKVWGVRSDNGGVSERLRHCSSI